MKTCSALLLVLASALGAAAMAHADDACTDFKWDVHKERALFAEKPVLVGAGTDLKSAPALRPDHLYRITLAPAASVKFPVPPARAASEDDYAGLALIDVPTDGSYRVSLELPVWIDVASDGALLKAKDYQGQHDCNAPHKIVVFELQRRQPLVLQLSRSAAEAVLVVLTAAPVRVQ